MASFPGGVLLVSQDGDVLFHQAFGQADLVTGTPVSTRTIFDLASLTKPLATTPAVLKLMERGQLTLDHTLGDVMISCRGTDKADISVRQLLYHNSGLPDYRPYFKKLADERPIQKKNVDPGHDSERTPGISQRRKGAIQRPGVYALAGDRRDASAAVVSMIWCERRSTCRCS